MSRWKPSFNSTALTVIRKYMIVIVRVWIWLWERERVCDLRVCQKEYICVKGCVRECKFLFEKERMCVCVKEVMFVCASGEWILKEGGVSECVWESGVRDERVSARKRVYKCPYCQAHRPPSDEKPKSLSPAIWWERWGSSIAVSWTSSGHSTWNYKSEDYMGLKPLFDDLSRVAGE